MCGFHWISGAFDGEVGAGQQMNVLGALSALLIDEAAVPLTNAVSVTSGPRRPALRLGRRVGLAEAIQTQVLT
jgi:hypothetical protein